MGEFFSLVVISGYYTVR